MNFEVVGDITEVETFAVGTSIRELSRLRRAYGAGRWRKRKGNAQVRLEDGSVYRAEVHWYEAHGIGRVGRDEDQAVPGRLAMPQTEPTGLFLLCVRNEGYPASLEVRKVYQALPDPVAASRGFVRVFDESGEDYLYPSECFVAVELPQAAARVFAGAM